MNSYAIIGTGAIGGFYGAKLQKAGHKVSFLLRSDYHHVADKGLMVQSVNGDFFLPKIDAYNDVNKMPRFDVVVLALKTTQNHLLPQILPPLLKNSSTILCLQNGLDIEPDFAKIVGDKTIISGLCFICANKVGPGHIRHLDYGSVKLAEYAANYGTFGITEKMRDIAQDLESAGIPVDLTEDLLLARWQKLVWNIPYNGLSVLLDARTDEIMQNPETRVLAEEIMREVVMGAKSCGRTISDRFIAKILDITDKMKPYLTSMKLDYDAKKPLEVEAIFGNPLRMASKTGVNLPRISMLYQQLKFLDARN